MWCSWQLSLPAFDLSTSDQRKPGWNVARTTVVRATFQPGFRWSEVLRAKAGTDTCQLHHTGYVASGQLAFAPDGGDEVVLSAGDVFDVPAGHDTWVVGDEPAVIIDFTGDDHLAKMLEWSGS